MPTSNSVQYQLFEFAPSSTNQGPFPILASGVQGWHQLDGPLRPLGRPEPQRTWQHGHLEVPASVWKRNPGMEAHQDPADREERLWADSLSVSIRPRAVRIRDRSLRGTW